MENPPNADFKSLKRRSSFDDSQLVKKLIDYFGKDLVNTTTLTPKLKLNAVIFYQGWMYKRRSVLSNWNERWFCLCEDFTLRMISNDGLDRTVIDLSSMIKPAKFYWSADGKTGTIQLQCVGRNWNLMVPGWADFKMWKSHLNQVYNSKRNTIPMLVFAGWLEKRGFVNKAWRNRYCQLLHNGMFSYSKSDSNGKLQGYFFLNNCTILNKKKVMERMFSIEQTERTWFFRARSKNEAQLWCRAIRPYVNSAETPDNQKRLISPEKIKTTISISFEEKCFSSPQNIDSMNTMRTVILKGDHFTMTPQNEEKFRHDSIVTGINSNSMNSVSLLPLYVDGTNKDKIHDSISLKFESVAINDIKNPKPAHCPTGLAKLDTNLHKAQTDHSFISKVSSSKQNRLFYQPDEKSETVACSLTERSGHLSLLAPSTSHKTIITLSSLREMSDWTYEDVLSSAFYRFAGISPYSSTLLRMSKHDLYILLKCLHLEEHCDDIYSRMSTVRSGQIPIGEFMSACLKQDIKTLIMNSKEYDFLVITLMTMKDIDPTQSKRLSKDDFYSLVDKYFDEDDAGQIFLKYDTDGVGQLHVANLFFFLKDYFDVENVDEDEKYCKS